MSGLTLRISRVVAGAALAVVLAGTATPAIASASVARPAASHSLLGKWRMRGGIFKFIKNDKGKYVDIVIKKRPHVFCPSVNDKSRQIIVSKAKHGWRLYRGEWKWFYYNCTVAGWGKTTITLSTTGKSARIVSDPPKGTSGSPEILVLHRITKK